MSKTYSFNKKNLINLLLNHTLYLQEEIRRKIGPRFVSKEECEKIAEDFLEITMLQGEVKMDDILDEMDEILEKMGKTTTHEFAEHVRDKKDSENNH